MKPPSRGARACRIQHRSGAAARARAPARRVRGTPVAANGSSAPSAAASGTSGLRGGELRRERLAALDRGAQRDRHEGEPPGAVGACRRPQLRPSSALAACSSAATRAAKRLEFVLAPPCASLRRGAFCAARTPHRRGSSRRARCIRGVEPLPRSASARLERGSTRAGRAPDRAARRRGAAAAADAAASAFASAHRGPPSAAHSPARRRPRRAASSVERARIDRRRLRPVGDRAACCSSRGEPRRDCRSSLRKAPARQSASSSKRERPPPRRSQPRSRREFSALGRPGRAAPPGAFTPDRSIRSRQPGRGALGRGWRGFRRRLGHGLRGGLGSLAFRSRINQVPGDLTGPDAISVAFRSMVGAAPSGACSAVLIVRLPWHISRTPGRSTLAYCGCLRRRQLQLLSSVPSSASLRPAAARPRIRPAPASRNGAATSADRQ